MNDLNTQQIVLLCLLVSFVSSVATGITTVSLLDQAPEPVAQTINRVVERTIEKVVDPVVNTVTNVATNKPQVERIVETVVVNQEDLTVEAVEQNAKSLVRIYGLNRDGQKFFIGLGAVVSADGKILTSSTVLEMAQKFSAEYPEGNYDISLETAPRNGAIILSPSGVEEGKAFTPAVFGNSQNIKLAQSVIALGGQDRNLVSTGIITSMETKEGEVSEGVEPKSSINLINTSISADTIIRGSVLMTLKGEIIGIRIMGASGGSFISSNSVRSSMGI